uniref:BZIP domain-containing protein n=1 Tax=Musa acuminata subsp. malaccensis TaxID=214687 RepID=A0A804JBL6_MUSAM|nr:PREDICTED: G-box-binding factor 1-like [Musa acuminata subsp. malaccensis]
MPMGSPKEKRTTGASSASTSSKAPREAAPPATALVPPEWSASFQAFYDRGAAAAAVMPQAFYSPSPIATAQPVVWGAQQVMPPYGSPIAYASFYPQGGFYAQPPINAGVAFRTRETEGRPTEAKDNQPTSKRTSKILEGSPGKSGNDGKRASGAGENASQSDDSETDGSSDTKEDYDQPKEHSPNRKRSYGNTTEGEGSHSFDTAGNSGTAGRVRTAKKLPVSAPGRAALRGPPTNLNIGMDFWGASPAGSVPSKDERDLRRERRKQSNRESARRSRLRKQQECEELARRVTDLNNENSALRVELENLQKLCGELEAENKSITGELKQRYGPEFLSELSSSIDASKLQSDVASS